MEGGSSAWRGGGGRSRQSTMEYMAVAEMPQWAQWGCRDDIMASPQICGRNGEANGELGLREFWVWFGRRFVSFRLGFVLFTHG